MDALETLAAAKRVSDEAWLRMARLRAKPGAK